MLRYGESGLYMESPANPSLLIVDDDVSFARAAAEIARTIPYDITLADGVRQAELRLSRGRFDLVLIDLVLPDGSGLDLVPSCTRQAADVVLVTGHPSIGSAVTACRTSLLDYLIKPIDPARYRDLLDRTARRRRLPPPVPGGGRYGLVGRSAALQRLTLQVERVAPTEASVLIHGESGVGKRLTAQAIHAASGRRGPFLSVCCADATAERLSTLLSDAVLHAAALPGAGGTVFLDEITELAPALQIQLLRALENQVPERRNLRIVAATVHAGDRSVSEGGLREDLYYRLGEFTIAIAPLRERADDIAALAGHFLAELNERHVTRKAFTGLALEQLHRFSWPGNVRELRNVIGHAYLMASGETINDPMGLVRVTQPLRETPGSLTVAVGTTLEEVERRMLMKTLEFFGNDKTKAARALGVSVKTIYNHLAKHQNPAESG